MLEVAFSDPYFASGQAWAVKEGSPIEALADLAGKTAAVGARWYDHDSS
jgi:ABC-type amino acid transport substrate-binding protein